MYKLVLNISMHELICGVISYCVRSCNVGIL